MQEILKNFLVGDVGECDFIKAIGLHELIEDVGTEYNRLGNLHGSILILVEVDATFDDVVKKSETSALSSQ